MLARLVRGLPGTALVTVDATLRAIALGTIAALAIAGALAPAMYVILLAPRRCCMPGATLARTR